MPETFHTYLSSFWLYFLGSFFTCYCYIWHKNYIVFYFLHISDFFHASSRKSNGFGREAPWFAKKKLHRFYSCVFIVKYFIFSRKYRVLMFIFKISGWIYICFLLISWIWILLRTVQRKWLQNPLQFPQKMR